jgi:hypothetical protein
LYKYNTTTPQIIRNNVYESGMTITMVMMMMMVMVMMMVMGDVT